MSVIQLHPMFAIGQAANDGAPVVLAPICEIWLSANELAEARLPGLPSSKRGVQRVASVERWHVKVSADGIPLARSRKGRGGGIEYNVDVLPPTARRKILKSYQPALPESYAATGLEDGIWSWFDQQNQTTKDDAANKLAVVLEIERLIESGQSVTAAIAIAAGQFGIGISTLNAWRMTLRGVSRSDWLPHLAPRYRGGGKQTDVDPDLWKQLVSQYLLPSKQPWDTCYYDVLGRAQAQGKTMPHKRTLLRKFRAEIDPLLVVKCREGKEALERATPSIIRDVSHMHAMQKVNIDGHLWDVFVRWPDGTESRPMMVAIQDVYSRKFLAWNIDRSENAVSVRKTFAKLLRTFGVPLTCLCDNGRAFASKWISGGTDTRNRWQIKPDDPLGLLPALGIKVEWAQPYHGQSKPIERSFGIFCNYIAKAPEFSGAYTGRSTQHKPHNYKSRVIDYDEFCAVVDRRIHELNARTGRKTQMAAGKLSLDQVFAASYAQSPIGKAKPEALSLALMDAKKAKTHRNDGSVVVEGNRYWSIDLSRIPGENVIVRYNPDNLKEDVRVYRTTGEFITIAPIWDAVGFDDMAGAGRIKKLRSDVRKLVKKTDDALDRKNAAELAELAKRYTVMPDVPEVSVVRLVRHRGQVAAALNPDLETAQMPVNPPKKASAMDRMAAAHARFKIVK